MPERLVNGLSSVRQAIRHHPDAFRLAWLRIETATARPLIVALDQVEEVFTIPSADERELSVFVDAVSQLFGADPSDGGRRCV